MGYDVFISHAHQDKSIADATCGVLEQRGIRCWIAPRDIQPGRDWGEAILEGIKSCRAFVLVFSAAANASPHITREVERAIHQGIPIIPVRIQGVMPHGSLEYHLGTVHWLDAMNPPLEAHLNRLASQLAGLLHVRPKASPGPVVGYQQPRVAVRPSEFWQKAAVKAGVLALVYGALFLIASIVIAPLAILGGLLARFLFGGCFLAAGHWMAWHREETAPQQRWWQSQHAKTALVLAAIGCLFPTILDWSANAQIFYLFTWFICIALAGIGLAGIGFFLGLLMHSIWQSIRRTNQRR